MAIAKCGGLVVDGSTLKIVNGIVTVSDGNPSDGFLADCGGVKFDSTYFKSVDGVVTDKNVSTVSDTIKTNCGGLMFDANHFDVVNGELTFDKLDSDANITSFTIDDAVGTISGTNISVSVPYGTDVTDLTPVITISDDATVSPASGVSEDFTSSVTYTVTAENGTTKAYTVTVVVLPNTACDITAFTIGEAEGVIDGTDISVEVPSGTDVTALSPVITVSTNATVSPASGASQDFTDAVTYTVTAEDGTTTKTYTVTVTVAA